MQILGVGPMPIGDRVGRSSQGTLAVAEARCARRAGHLSIRSDQKRAKACACVPTLERSSSRKSEGNWHHCEMSEGRSKGVCVRERGPSHACCAPLVPVSQLLLLVQPSRSLTPPAAAAARARCVRGSHQCAPAVFKVTAMGQWRKDGVGWRRGVQKRRQRRKAGVVDVLLPSNRTAAAGGWTVRKDS